MPDRQPSGCAALLRQKAFALGLFAGQLACAADSFGTLACALFRRLFIRTAGFHLPENTLALHLLLEHFKGLIDIVVANDNLQWTSFFSWRFSG